MGSDLKPQAYCESWRSSGNRYLNLNLNFNLDTHELPSSDRLGAVQFFTIFS